MSPTPQIHDQTNEVARVFCSKILGVVDPKEARCIELFARNGERYTRKIANYFENFLGIDIDDSFSEGFQKFCPNGRFIAGDAHNILASNSSEIRHGFSVISIDNPLGVFGSNQEYCEHFNILNLAARLLSRRGALIFNVVPEPYDYENLSNQEWRIRRSAFYSSSEAKFPIQFLSHFYESFFWKFGFDIIDLEFSCREIRNGVPYFYSCLALLDNPGRGDTK